MSWYVLEGPDDTGKTSLARGLERRGWFYQHSGPEDAPMSILAKRMAVLQEVENVVWDRAHLGEVVHGPLDRNTAPSLGWWRLIEAFLQEKGARCILLRIRQGKPEEWENDDQRQRILVERFDQAARDSTLYWGGYPDPMPRGRLAGDQGAIDFFEDRTDPEGLGGGERPDVWILGEQESSKTPVPWPFATRCGIELVWPAVNPRSVRVSNVLQRLPVQRLNPTYLHERWEQLGEPVVIALGSSVERWCLISGVPVDTKLPHPQWHLRFHAHETQRYIYHLSTAILRGMRKRYALPS